MDVHKPTYFDELAELTAAQTADATAAALAERERDMARYRREERLAGNAFFDPPAVTPDTKAAVIRGALRRDVHALDVVMSWWECFHGLRPGRHLPILVLLGAKGRGKTAAGTWLIAEEGGLYITAQELAKRICTKLPRDANWTADVLRSRVTVLDDVGTETEDEREDAVAAMWEFVNRRHALGKAFTVITSNLRQPDFIARQDERTIARIMQVGRIVQVQGEDLRLSPPRWQNG